MKVDWNGWEECPTNRASCLNCTRKGGGCARSASNKQQHNGMYYRNGEVVGVIIRCVHYTGPYAARTSSEASDEGRTTEAGG